MIDLINTAESKIAVLVRAKIAVVIKFLRYVLAEFWRFNVYCPDAMAFGN